MATRPQVNIYQSKEGVAGLPGSPRVTPDMTGAGIGRAVSALGSDLGVAADAYQKQQEREARILQEAEDKRATVEAHTVMATAELDAITTSMGLEETNAKTPAGHGERVGAALDTYGGKILEGITNPRAREYANVQMAQLKTRQLVRAITWERQQTRTNNVASVNDVAESVSNAAHADEYAYAAGIEKVRAVMDLTGLGDDEVMRDKLENAIAYKTSLGWAKRNPSLAMAAADTRSGLKQTERPPAYMNAVQRAEWRQATPEARRALEYSTEQPPDYFSAGQLKEWKEAPAAGRRALEQAAGAVRGGNQYGRANAGDYIQPPDTAVTATGVPGKTGIPFWDKLTPEQSIAIRNGAEQDYKVDVGALQARVRGMAADATAEAHIGKSREIAPLSLYVEAYGPDRGTEMHRADSYIPLRGARRGTLMSMDYASLAAEVNRAIPDDLPPGVRAEEIRSRAEDQKHMADILEMRQKDWISVAPKMGVATTVEIDWNKPAAAEAELRTRQGVALSAEKYAPGASKTALSVPEATALRSVLHRLPANDVVRVLATMRKSLTDPSVYHATVQSVAPDNVSLQIAASIATASDPAAIATAEMIVRGDRELNPNKYQRKEDGKTTHAATLPKDFAEKFATAVGPAFAANPGNYTAALQASGAFYIGTATMRGQMGAGTAENADPNLTAQAIAAVVGVPFTFGTSKVLAPRGMDISMAKTRLDAAWAHAMESNGIAGTFIDRANEARLINVPNAQGKYYIAAGDNPYHGADGRPIVLDINGGRTASGRIK